MVSSSKVVRPEEVLESLKNDGTIDALRMKIIAQLKANEDMKKNTMMMVEQSKVLSTPGAEKKTKRELFDTLRQELDQKDRAASPVLFYRSFSPHGSILARSFQRTVTPPYMRSDCSSSARPPVLLRRGFCLMDMG